LIPYVADCLEQSQRTDGVHISSRDGLFETDANVALGSEVIDLVRSDFPYQPC
jgi:hypothetical protein